MRILTWNLYHGRALPPAGRDLQDDFAAALAGWAWDVALLQEVPPWWPAPLARACGASARSVLTSRNALLPLRRWIARRAPDLIKSNGGGCNAILVRGTRIAEHHTVQLRARPERRTAHAVRLEGDAWIANLHAQVHSETFAQADLATAAAAVDGWAGVRTPVILGGDTNTRRPHAGDLTLIARHDVDAIMARGWRADGPHEVLDHGHLSDHAPVAVTLAPPRPAEGARP